MRAGKNKFKYRNGRPIENPIGHYVAAAYKGRTLLGEVTGARYDHFFGAVVLTVRHFNGEPWPADIRPTYATVEVLR